MIAPCVHRDAPKIVKSEVLKIGDMLEGAASTQPSARTAAPADPPAFGRTLLGMLGGEPTAAPTAGPDIEPEAEAEKEPEHDPADEDVDTRLMALLPGLDLLVRATVRPVSDAVVASTSIPRMAPALPALAPTAAAEADRSASGATGVESKPVPGRAFPAIAAPPASTAAQAADSARTQPATMTADTVSVERDSSRIAAGLAESSKPTQRSPSTREGVAAAPAAAELQARLQFAARTATASPSPIIAAIAQDTAEPARARPATPPPPVSTSPASELVTRIAGDKADSVVPPPRSSASPSVPGAPGIGAPGTAAAPVISAATATPDLAGAEGRAAWQQALVRHVALIVAGETAEARLQVESGKLGPIEIRVKIDGERVDVRFSIQHPITASLVQEAMPRLEKMLEQQGFSLAHSSIDQGQSREQGGRDPSPAGAAPGAAGDGDPSAGGTTPLQPVRSRAANALLDDFA